MRVWEKVLYSIVKEGLAKNEDAFRKELRQALSDLGISAKQFSKIARVSKSTLYKIMSSRKKDIRLSNVREIVLGIKEIEQGKSAKGNVIALIADRGALEGTRKELVVNGHEYQIDGYPATNIEEAIIQGISAERDGVKAIICGPITAYTLEKVVTVPVVSLRLKPDQIQSAIDTAVKKIL